MRVVCLRVLVLAWVVACLAATQDRARLWLSEPALWADAARHAPEKPRPWVNLGKEYAITHADHLAAWAYEQAMVLAMRPGRSKDEQVFGLGIAAANLALLRCQADGDLQGALAIVVPLLDRRANPSQPIATAVKEVHTWLEHRATAGGCAPVSSY